MHSALHGGTCDPVDTQFGKQLENNELLGVWMEPGVGITGGGTAGAGVCAAATQKQLSAKLHACG